MNKQVKHPSGRVLVYNDKYHSYYFKDDPYKKLVSATTLIKKFFPKFDMEEVSKRYAEKHGIDQDIVKAKWKAEGEYASDLGDMCHNFVDSLIKSVELPKPKTKIEQLYFNTIKDTLKILVQDAVDVETEIPIASVQHMVAGTIDLIMKKHNKIYIYDWKTNKEIKMNNKWQSGFQCCSHLDDCNFNHYSLQLNLYKYILTTEGYYDNISDYEMVILHITQNGCVPYAVQDMSDVIRRMLELYV